MTGFANALILVPLLSLFLDIKIVVPIAALLGLVSGMLLLRGTRKEISKEFIFILIFVVIGTVIGTHLFVTSSPELLKTFLGIVIIIFSIQIFLNKTFKKINKWWGVFFGVLSGILGGMYSANGPPLVIYFGNKLEKKSFRATINAILFIGAIWINLLYAARGVMTLEIIKLALMFLPALVVGIYLGSKVHYKINEVMFKRLVASILFVVGVAFIL